jgi:parallel beta-helix repeat protein
VSGNLLRQLLAISIVAALCQSVYAADGVVLIDQKAVTNGKVTEGDTPGFPVTISEPGSYRLNSNLVVPDVATTAIQITADNVTLDLGGFSIIGPNTCTPNPVQCTYSGASGIGVVAAAPSGASPANVRVLNGTVRGMGGYGIRMPGDGSIVERVIAASNGGPGIVVGQGSVIDSIANLNAAGAAIVGLIVRGSIATNNAVGIAVHPGGVAIGNSASYNGRGIYLTRATAANNTVNNNLDYGILNVCPGVLVGNTITGNGTDLVTSGLCTLDDNSAAPSAAGQ